MKLRRSWADDVFSLSLMGTPIFAKLYEKHRDCSTACTRNLWYHIRSVAIQPAKPKMSDQDKGASPRDKPYQKYESTVICLGYFSVNENRDFLPNSSSLMYFNPPTEDNVCLDLNEGIESAVRRVESLKSDGLKHLLTWIQLNSKNIRASSGSDRLLQPKFICTRGTLTKIMTSACSPLEEWTIYAAKWKGSIYLCSEKMDKWCKVPSSTNDKFSSWGFKFEQCVLSASPDKAPDTTKPVLEPAEFRCVYQRCIGEHPVLFSAVMKGVLSKTKLKDPLPLHKLKFVETKTNKLIEHAGHERTLHKYKFLNWWAQCYLTNTRHVLCGFKDESGIVHKLTKYDIKRILESSRQYWKPSIAINYCETVLNTFSETVVDESNETIYRFTKVANEGVKMERLSPEEQHVFLPQSYMDKLE